jgi:hypothetical protein
MDERTASREKQARILATIMGVLMAGGVLLVLYLSLGVVLLYGLGIVAGITFVGLLHYWTWGRALMAETAEERAQLLIKEEAERNAAAASAPWERRF